jgi:hypothetical protein
MCCYINNLFSTDWFESNDKQTLVHTCCVLNACIVWFYSYIFMGRDSPVDMVTFYGLDGPGIKPWWGKIFCARPDRPCGPPSLLYNEYWVFPRGKKAPGGDWSPTPSSAKVKEGVEPYLYSPSGPSWPVLGWTLPWPLPFTFTFIHIFIDLYMIIIDTEPCLFVKVHL